MLSVTRGKATHNQFNILQGYGVFVVGVGCMVGVTDVLGNCSRKPEQSV
jgi:hypothetical protein